MKEEEVFIEIPKHENYLCSNKGTIMSKRFMKPIKGSLNSAGYLRVRVGKGKRVFIHRIVALLFVPKVEGKLFVNHKDGDRLNNKAENLEWCTVSENALHAFSSLGRKPVCGSKHGGSKLCEEQVLEIRQKLKNGYTPKEISIVYGVSPRTIRDIKNNVLWKHI